MNGIAASRVDARGIALEILHDIDVNSAYVKVAFDRRLKKKRISREDKGLVTELVFGTLRWRLRLDYIIGSFSNIPMSEMSPWVRNILRLGIYQLLHTDRIPSSAAVNESVKLSKRYGQRPASGFINGILRNIDRRKHEIAFPSRDENPVGYLSVMHSHPSWLVRRWLDRYGFSFTEELLCSNNEKPDFTIRANTLKNETRELAGLLEKRGFKVTAGRYVPEALIVENPSGILDTLEYSEGRFVVQDEAAMLVSVLLAPEPGESVIDLCSAPGGKATHIAQMMQNNGGILAWDIHSHRLKLLERNILDAGASIITGELRDAAVTHDEYRNSADRVLADVPCSGLGIIRKQPDIKWAREEKHLGELPWLQYGILEASAGYIKPGGVLVYSTCTIEHSENEEVIMRFLDATNEFYIEQAEAFLPRELHGAVGDDGMVRLFPNRHKVDGFFMARLRKKAKK
jgi:16S rRNA (cytosine967-C5)-methyltransferase